MIGATKCWFRRNRKGLAIGAGVVGVGYLAGQYVLSKISEARERMSSDRIAKEKYVPISVFISPSSSF
jgi:peroxin-3